MESTGYQENETHLDELNNMVEERLVGLQRGLTDQIDGVTGWMLTLPTDSWILVRAASDGKQDWNVDERAD